MVDEEFKFSQFSSFKSNGETRQIKDLDEHMKKADKENITYKKRLKVGDKVKLKGLDYTVVIQYVEYEIPGLGKIDYAGKRTDDMESERLCIFNQKDIDHKVEEKEKEEEER